MAGGKMISWAEAEKQLAGIENQFTPSLARILFEHAQKLPDDAVILEIGPYKGYTTCALALACLDTQRRIYTIDTFHGRESNTDEQDGPSYFGAFWKNITARGLDAYVTPRVGRSEKFYESWQTPLDLLFIDGGHQPEVVAGDVLAFFPHLRKGGLLFMHDVYRESVQSANTYPTWNGVQLQLANCQYKLNLAWGVKL